MDYYDIEKRVNDICQEIRSFKTFSSVNSSEKEVSTRKIIQTILEKNSEFLINELGIIHPSIMFNDIETQTYTVVTNTVPINSRIINKFENSANLNSVPVLYPIGVDIFSKEFDLIHENLFGDDSRDVYRCFLDLIYLPEREYKKDEPEFIENLNENYVNHNVLLADQYIIVQKSLKLFHDHWQNSEGKIDFCGFINDYKKRIELTIANKAYKDVNSNNFVKNALSLFDLISMKYEGVNNIERKIKSKSQTLTITNIEHPIEPYAMLILIINLRNIEKSTVLLKSSLDHVVFIVKRDFSKSAYIHNQLVQGLIVATYQLNENNRNEKTLDMSYKIWNEIYNIFHDRVLYDSFIYQRGFNEANIRMFDVSGHTIKNMLHSIHSQLVTFSTRNLQIESQKKSLEPLINLASGMSKFFDTLRKMGSGNLIGYKLDECKQNYVSLYDVFIYPFLDMSYPLIQPTRKKPLGRISIIETKLHPSSLFTSLHEVNLKSAQVNDNIWLGNNATFLESIIWEIFLNIAKHGKQIQNSESFIKTENQNYAILECYIQFVEFTKDNQKKMGIIFGNYLGKVSNKYTEDYSEYTHDDKSSISLLNQLLKSHELGKMYVRNFSSEGKFRYETLIELEGIRYINEN